MNYANIKYNDIANGPGCRTTLFVSGCRFHCKNCFNSEAWDFSYGEPFTNYTQETILESLQPKHISGLTILGGEPMEPENRKELAPFLERVKTKYPEKGIWLFSGFTLEELQEISKLDPSVTRILDVLDVLVDGLFVQDLYDMTLRFRGSSNQRLIDIPKTLEKGSVVEWWDGPIYGTRAKFIGDDSDDNAKDPLGTDNSA